MESQLTTSRSLPKGWIKTCLGVLLMSVATASSATTLFSTDTSWQVTPTAALATTGWNDSTAFVTSGWQTATPLYNVSLYLPGYSAQGIWSSGGQYSMTETTMWARGIFNLSTLPLSASLEFGIDDDGDLYLNGTQIVSNHDGSAGNVFVADILPLLHVGDNLIAFTASDNFPVWGYNHSAWVEVTGSLAQVPEPASLALLGLGLAGLAVARRRKPQ